MSTIAKPQEPSAARTFGRDIGLVHQHHALPDIRSPHALQRERDTLSGLRGRHPRPDIWDQHTSTRGDASPTQEKRGREHCTYRLRSMDLMTVPWKFPFESGPKSTASPDLTVPELRMPSTTVPTYGTEYTSVIEYCSARQRRRDGVRERKRGGGTSRGWSVKNFSWSPSLAGSRFKKVRSCEEK